MKFKSDIEVQAGLKDSSGSSGSSGQILSSTNGNVSWVTPTTNTVARDVQNQVKAGVAINKGQAVYVTDADGTNIIVGLASNTTEATSSKTLGLLNATVSANGFADVVQIGKLSGLNTSTATIGDPVWLGTNGNLIYGLANKPYAPSHLVYIGVVTRVNANNGEIFVTVQNGFELKEIHDVDVITTTPVNGNVLGYNGTLWVNKTIPTWLGYTPADQAITISTTAPLSGGGNLSANRTLSISQAGSASNGYLSSTDWTTFNNKQSALTNPVTGTGGNTEVAFFNSAGSTITSNANIKVVGGQFQTASLKVSTFGAGMVYSDSVGNVGTLTGTTDTLTYWNSAGSIGSLATTAYPSLTEISYVKGVTSSIQTQLNAKGTGTVTSVSGTGGYGGLTLSGTVTTSGSLTLGGTPTGTWPISVSGTAAGETLATVTGKGNTTTSNILLNGGTSYMRFGPNSTWGATLQVGGDGVNAITRTNLIASVVATDGNMHLDSGSAKAIYLNYYSGTGGINFGSGANTIIGTMSNVGDFTANSSARSPIFYDSNDTSYYLNPNGDSRLSRTYIGNYTNYMTLGAWDGVNNRIEAVGQPLFLTSYGGSIKLGYSGNNQMELLTSGILNTSSSISTTYVAPGYINRNIPNKQSYVIGSVGDYIQHVILLHPVYNGTLIQYNECDGIITKRRGSSSSGLSYGSYKAQTKSAYNTSVYSMTSTLGDGQLYTCTYGGVKYVALMPDYTVSAVEYGFDGYIVGDSNSLTIIPYRNSSSGTILNTEVNNSLVVVTGTALTSFREAIASTIYYDIDNTGYYLDPASGSNINNLTIAGTLSGGNNVVYGDNANGRSKSMNSGNANTSDSSNSSGFYFGNSVTGMPSTDWWNWLTVAGGSWSGSDGYRWQMTGSFWSDDWRLRRMTSGSWGSWVSMLHSGNYSSYSNFSGSVYGSIFYDYNDTAYYGDFASTSRLNSATLTGLLQVAGTGGNYNEGMRLTSGTGSWSNIQFGANTTGVGTQTNQWIVGKRPDGNFVMSLAGNQEGASRFLIDQGGGVQSPIYYDGNNTGYYVDPASNSNFNTGTFNGALTSYAATTNAGLNCTMAAGMAGGNGAVFNGSTGNAYGSSAMTVYGSSYGAAIRFVIGSTTYTNNTVAAWFYNNNTTLVGSISCSTTATTYATSSDYRLKENVMPMPSSIERLNALKPCRFNFINEPTKKVDGFIAHEVQEVVPEAVTGHKDELDPTGEPVYQGIDQSKIVPLLTAALQEAIEKINSLEKRINILENK
jgi:Chaperone of endosialidase